jgi:hypothetical protein
MKGMSKTHYAHTQFFNIIIHHQFNNKNMFFLNTNGHQDMHMPPLVHHAPIFLTYRNFKVKTMKNHQVQKKKNLCLTLSFNSSTVKPMYRPKTKHAHLRRNKSTWWVLLLEQKHKCAYVVVTLMELNLGLRSF